VTLPLQEANYKCEPDAINAAELTTVTPGARPAEHVSTGCSTPRQIRGGARDIVSNPVPVAIDVTRG
jgi:hypothetical protein